MLALNTEKHYYFICHFLSTCLFKLKKMLFPRALCISSKQIVNIDSASSIGIYSLSTVASAYQISINEEGIINESADANGFAETVAVWTP